MDYFNRSRQLKNLMELVNEGYDNFVPSVLVENYLKEIGADLYIKIADAARRGSDDYPIGEGFSQISLHCFYMNNKAEILNWMVDCANQNGFKSVLRYIQELAKPNDADGKLEHYERAYSLDNISESLYGDRTEKGWSHGTFVMLIAKKVISDIGYAYLEANRDFKEIDTPALITQYLSEFSEGWLYGASETVVIDYIDTVGAENFDSNAILQSQDLLTFYEKNRDDLVTWIKKYLRENKKVDMLEFLESQLKTEGYIVDIDSIGCIIHGNLKNESSYPLVAGCVAEVFGRALKDEYKDYKESGLL